METQGRWYNTDGNINYIGNIANINEEEGPENTQIYHVVRQSFTPSVENNCLDYLHKFSTYFKTMPKRFDYSEHDELKKYLAGVSYSNSIDNLTKKEKARIRRFYNKIRYNSELYSEAIGVIEVEIHCICLVDFIRNGTELIAIRDAFKAVPVFAVRKCRGPDNNNDYYCRSFIDKNLYVYPEWKNFLKENYLHSSVICAPVNGRYSFNENDELHVEFTPTPRTNWGYIIWRIIDVFLMLTFIGAGIASYIISRDSSEGNALHVIAIVQYVSSGLRLIYLIYHCIKYKRYQWCKNKDPAKYQHIERELVKCEQCPGHYYKNRKL